MWFSTYKRKLRFQLFVHWSRSVRRRYLIGPVSTWFLLLYININKISPGSQTILAKKMESREIEPKTSTIRDMESNKNLQDQDFENPESEAREPKLQDLARLSFAVVSTSSEPQSSDHQYTFSIDKEFDHTGYRLEFGPFDLGVLYRYCCKVDELLKSDLHAGKTIGHYSGPNEEDIANAAFLYGSYLVINFKRTPEEAYRLLSDNGSLVFRSFRDASNQPSTYDLTVLDCLHAVDKAVKIGWLDFKKFDAQEYTFYNLYENGDLNWIIPKKILAFPGPVPVEMYENGCICLTPEAYFPYFRKNNVSTIIRLNDDVYDPNRFTENGFEFHHLFFKDGTAPPDCIMEKFLEIVENASGAIAVHCKSGLGRTGTVIACYIMKHYHFTAAEAIAWVRICRPASIIGYQQHWLQAKQDELWFQGSQFKLAAENANSSSDKKRKHSSVESCETATSLPKDESVVSKNKSETPSKRLCTTPKLLRV